MGTSVDKGLPLFPAIRTFSDPAAWAELEELLAVKVNLGEKDGWTAREWARHDFRMMLPLGLAPLGSDSPAGLKNLQALNRWARLKTAFRERLQSGELVATGYVKPVTHDDRRIVIDPDMWGFLEPDFRDSTASGGGMEVIHVAVHPPGSEASAISGELAASDTAGVSPDPYRTGLPGRTTIKHLILAEFQRRAAAGEVERTLAAEARALQKWATREHQNAPTPAPGTIENHIREKYRHYQLGKPTKRPTK